MLEPKESSPWALPTDSTKLPMRLLPPLDIEDGRVGVVTIDEDGPHQHHQQQQPPEIVPIGQVDRAPRRKSRPSTTSSATGAAAIAHPKGTYFRDERRRVDYVLVYENAQRGLSVSNVVQNLRRLARYQLPAGADDSPRVPRRGAPWSSPASSPRFARRPNNYKDLDQIRREFYLSQLLKAGLELEMHEYEERRIERSRNRRSSGGGTRRKLIFVKVHAPWSVLRREAERLRIKLPLRLRDSYEGGADEDDRIHWPFAQDQSDRFDLPLEQPERLLETCRRSEIVWELMQSTRNDPLRPRSRGIESLVDRAVFEASFPLHDGDYRQRKSQSAAEATSPRRRLRIDWASARASFRPQPLDRIRRYFGEKVGFYFAFLDYYSRMLLIPSVVGAAMFAYGVGTSWTRRGLEELASVCDTSTDPGRILQCPLCSPPSCQPHRLGDEESCPRLYWQYRLDNWNMLVGAALNSLWCVLFVKFWRRREAALALEWGTEDVHGSLQERVVMRPDYQKRANSRGRNSVTGEWEPRVPEYRRLAWKALSASATVLMLIFAGVCMAILIVCRVLTYGLFKNMGGFIGKHNIEAARWIQHGFMFLTVSAFETIYHRVAERLTARECPKTSSDYMSSLLWKIFLFAHLVDFLPIGYVAWLKGRFWSVPERLSPITEMCEAGGCMNEVIELVSVLLLLRLFVQNLVELSWPAIRAACARFRTRRRGVERKMQDSVVNTDQWSQFLKDYHLAELKLDGVAGEYMEMMIQFSFVAFFTPILPLVPLMCLINNIIEIRIDAYNLLASHRRPSPVRADGIQIWNRFLDLIVKASVVINAALLAFTSELVPRLLHAYKTPSGEDASFGSYVNWSLSYQPVDEWPQFKSYVDEIRRRTTMVNSIEVAHGDHHDELSFLENATHCAYFGHRETDGRRSLNGIFYEIMTARLALFAIYVVVFYFLINLVNSYIDDSPVTVRDTIRRRRYLVTRDLERQAFVNRTRKLIESSFVDE